ncbi:MAG TPA: ATP-binding protein [Usitatibacter sp.]|nr:ATP-binding protein [Usitatibacter sp.]
MPTPRTAAAAQRLSRLLASSRRWVVLAMLLALHAALIAPPGEIYQRLWLMVHFGLFLLWQPFFSTERELEIFSVVMLLTITAITLYFLSGWMIVFWLLLLLGILGGRVFTIQAARRSRFYLVAFAYVLAMLLTWAVPVLIVSDYQLPQNVAMFARRIVPFVLLALVVLPFPSEDDAGQVFDFFYAVLVFQLCVVLALGSIVNMRFTEEDYVESVLLTVTGFGIALFALAVLWNPIRGFGGLSTYFSTYLLSVGMPFELWMRRIAELAETEPDAQTFLELALKEVAALPWIRGAHWQTQHGEGRFGAESDHNTRFEYHDLAIVFHTNIDLSPALFLHMRLLSQVVGEFYVGKLRESALKQHAYLQAVHETGARLTHDMKNLMQALYALTSMAPREPAGGYTGLLQRQLPQLTKRLQTTLDKLRSPEIPSEDLPVRAGAWWNEVSRRMAGGDVVLEADITADGNIPATLFDTFVENAVANARTKGLREPGVSIRVSFHFSAERVELVVTDSGTAVPASAEAKLFREPVERGAGLGIGLYHVARLATQTGYLVELAANRDGEVSFRLSHEAEAAAASAGGQG